MLDLVDWRVSKFDDRLDQLDSPLLKQADILISQEKNRNHVIIWLLFVAFKKIIFVHKHIQSRTLLR